MEMHDLFPVLVQFILELFYTISTQKLKLPNT